MDATFFFLRGLLCARTFLRQNNPHQTDLSVEIKYKKFQLILRYFIVLRESWIETDTNDLSTPIIVIERERWKKCWNDKKKLTVHVEEGWKINQSGNFASIFKFMLIAKNLWSVSTWIIQFADISFYIHVNSNMHPRLVFLISITTNYWLKIKMQKVLIFIFSTNNFYFIN